MYKSVIHAPPSTFRQELFIESVTNS